MSYAVWLRSRLEKRRERNPSYSLRAYAKALGVSPATLSALLRAKRQLSLAAALKIADCEGLSPEERRVFLSGLTRGPADLRAGGVGKSKGPSFAELDIDRYRVVADWYHFAILSLGELPGSRLDPRWISQRLGITAREASDAVGRLRRLGLLKRVGTGFKQATGPLTTPVGISSSAIRTSHRQLLAKAEGALDEVPLELRDFGAIIMGADPERLDEARELIRRLRRELCSLLESGSPRAVYAFTMQLFPLTKES